MYGGTGTPGFTPETLSYLRQIQETTIAKLGAEGPTGISPEILAEGDGIASGANKNTQALMVALRASAERKLH